MHESRAGELRVASCELWGVSCGVRVVGCHSFSRDAERSACGPIAPCNSQMSRAAEPPTSDPKDQRKASARRAQSTSLIKRTAWHDRMLAKRNTRR
ncbi:MAG: hypothetical protein IT425_05665 [Pirellulales bacterium]|nr:hypothetical protein [Pirellulales bacterium]